MRQPLALIIVDTLDVASLAFRQTLDLAGYQTELMVCDQITLAQIAQIQPKVIFLHHSLAKVPQVEIFEQYQMDEIQKNTPVIALASNNEVAKNLYSLASVVLVKPIARERLFELLPSMDNAGIFVDQTPWDALTGLCAPAFFLARLNQVIKRSQKNHHDKFVLFSINLDQLMAYEKKFGKEYRQHLLQGVAKVLKKVLHPADVVTCFETNLFMVLVDNDIDRYTPTSIADCMRFEFDEFLVTEGLKNRIKIDIDVFHHTEHYKTANDVLKDARQTLKTTRPYKHRDYENNERRKLPHQPSGIRSLTGA
jgi:diguanylate cyclase (GGDEF)-like protein